MEFHPFANLGTKKLLLMIPFRTENQCFYNIMITENIIATIANQQLSEKEKILHDWNQQFQL